MKCCKTGLAAGCKMDQPACIKIGRPILKLAGKL